MDTTATALTAATAPPQLSRLVRQGPAPRLQLRRLVFRLPPSAELLRPAQHGPLQLLVLLALSAGALGATALALASRRARAVDDLAVAGRSETGLRTGRVRR